MLDAPSNTEESSNPTAANLFFSSSHPIFSASAEGLDCNGGNSSELTSHCRSIEASFAVSSLSSVVNSLCSSVLNCVDTTLDSFVTGQPNTLSTFVTSSTDEGAVFSNDEKATCSDESILLRSFASLEATNFLESL